MATGLNRDRLFYLAGASDRLCSKNARKLLKKAPCLGADGTINARCGKQVDKLSICAPPCSHAASLMITVPCSSDLMPAACQSALAALWAC